jgi:hypothetical protein
MSESQEASQKETERAPRVHRADVARAGVLILLTIAALSVAYYYVIALPSQSRARLAFEREKFQAEQETKAAQAKAEEDARAKAESAAIVRQMDLDFCTSAAEDLYWEYVKLNGQAVEGKPSVYTAPQHVWDRAEKRKKAALDECHREFAASKTKGRE